MEPNRTCLRSVVVLAVFAALLLSFSPSSSESQETDVCLEIPGDTVAKAVSGRIVETKTSEGRCVYFVTLPGKDTEPHAFVIYRHPPADYEGLRDVMEGLVEPVPGVGDEAAINFDADQQRYWLLVVAKDRVALQVSGDDKKEVCQVAAAAVQQYRR